MVLLQRQGAVNRLLLVSASCGSRPPRLQRDRRPHRDDPRPLAVHDPVPLRRHARIDPASSGPPPGSGPPSGRFRRGLVALSRPASAPGASCSSWSRSASSSPRPPRGREGDDARDADRGPREPGPGLAARLGAGSGAAGRHGRRAGAGPAALRLERWSGQGALTWRSAWRWGRGRAERSASCSCPSCPGPDVAQPEHVARLPSRRADARVVRARARRPRVARGGGTSLAVAALAAPGRAPRHTGGPGARPGPRDPQAPRRLRTVVLLR